MPAAFRYITPFLLMICKLHQSCAVFIYKADLSHANNTAFNSFMNKAADNCTCKTAYHITNHCRRSSARSLFSAALSCDPYFFCRGCKTVHSSSASSAEREEMSGSVRRNAKKPHSGFGNSSKILTH